jgi:hypothetical protein
MIDTNVTLFMQIMCLKKLCQLSIQLLIVSSWSSYRKERSPLVFLFSLIIVTSDNRDQAVRRQYRRESKLTFLQ